MALTSAQSPLVPVETRSVRVHPSGAELRMPKVVVLPKRPGRMTDEHQRRGARALAGQGRADEMPPDGPDEADMSRPRAAMGATQRAGLQAHAAEVLPLLVRRELPCSRGPSDADPDIDREIDGGSGIDGGIDIDRNIDADADADADADSSADEGAHFASSASPAPRSAGAEVQGAADDATLAAWIARIVRQDERALEALYDATASRVQALVLRITQRHALAEEVLEDTFWQVWRQAPRFDAARGRPITWLLAMARSRAIDALRREQRFQHDELPDDDVADAADGGGTLQPAPQDLLEATRGHAQVHAAIAALEPRSRQLVALAFFRGLTHEEIAEQQQMPLGTVKSLIRRALQQLKRVMEADHA